MYGGTLLYSHLLWVQEAVDKKVTCVDHISALYVKSLFFPIALQCFALLHLSKSNKSVTEPLGEMNLASCSLPNHFFFHISSESKVHFPLIDRNARAKFP